MPLTNSLSLLVPQKDLDARKKSIWSLFNIKKASD